MNPDKINKSRITLLILIIISTVFFSFLPSLRNDFVSWDDDVFLVNNGLIKDLSWDNIGRILASPKENLCKPVLFLFLAVEYHFFKLDPFFYHLINLLFHQLNCLLVFWLILLLTGKPGISFITALLFGIHPLQVESVAWAFQIKNMLSGFFFLWALVLYIYYSSSHKTKYYCLALICFVLSLLSKPIGIALPFLLIIIDYLKRRKFDLYAYLDKIPFLLASLGISAMTLMFSGFSVNDKGLTPNSFLTLPYQISFYLDKALLPLKLSCLYPDIAKLEISRPPLNILYPALLVFLAAAVIISRRHTRKIVFGSLFFLFSLVPAFSSRMRYATAYIVADHFVYLALIGIFYLVAEGFFWLLRRKEYCPAAVKALLILILVSATGSLSFITYRRNKVWKDSITLWSDVLRNYPDNLVAYDNRGLAYVKKKEYELALSDFNRLIGSNIDSYNKEKTLPGMSYTINLSSLYISEGQYDKTIALLENAISRNPSFGYKYINNLAVAYARSGKTEQAITLLRNAIENNEPVDKAEYCYNLALIYKSIGNIKEARSLFERSIQYNDSYANAYYGLAKLYEDNHQIENAVSYYRKAIAYGPRDEKIYNDLAALYYSTGKYKEAIRLFKQSLKINPDFIEAYNNLGMSYCMAGKNKEAINTLKKLLGLDPKDGQAHNNISLAYCYDGKFDLAVRHCDTAIELGYKVSPELLELLKPYRK